MTRAEAEALVEDGLMTRQEAAAFLRVSVTTIKVLLRDGWLPVVRVGRRPLIPRRALVTYAAERVEL